MAIVIVIDGSSDPPVTLYPELHSTVGPIKAETIDDALAALADRDHLTMADPDEGTPC